MNLILLVLRMGFGLLRTLLLPLLFIGLLFVVFYSPAVLNKLFLFSKPFLGSSLQIESVTGQLKGPMVFHRVHYENTLWSIDIDNLTLDWRPSALLQGQFVITELACDKMTAHQFAAPTALPGGPAYPAASVVLNSITAALQKFNRYIETVKIGQAQIISQQNIMNVTGTIARVWDLDLQASVPQLQPLFANTTGAVQITGKISGERTLPQLTSVVKLKQVQFNFNQQVVATFAPATTVQIQATLKPERLALAATLQPTLLRYEIQEKTHNLPVLTSKFMLEVSKQGTQSQLHMSLPAQQFIKAQLFVPAPATKSWFKKFDPSLQGQIALSLNQLDYLPLQFGKLEKLQGKLNVTASILGTLAAPSIKTDISFINGTALLPELGLKLKNLTLQAQGSTAGGNQSHFAFTVRGQSGPGVLTGQGTADWRGQHYTMTLSAKGNHFLFINTPAYQAYATPDLQLKMQDKHLEITGNVLVPQAKLVPEPYEGYGLLEAADVVFVDGKHQVTVRNNFTVDTQLKLTLGNQVYLTDKGLKARLTGSLLLQDKLAQPTVATGELYLVDGTYQLRGQALKINKDAKLTFTGGPVDDPGINLQIVRNINNALLATPNTPSAHEFAVPNFIQPGALMNNPQTLMVGVNVQGTLKQQQLTLFSEPTLTNQAEILAYLLLGHSLNQASVADAQFLLEGASAFGANTGQLSSLVQQLQQQFSLDELGIQSTPLLLPGTSTPLQNTSLVLGKSLSPRLYINYSIGLIEPINTLKLSYLLGKKWRLQTETNSLASGVDLLYTFER